MGAVGTDRLGPQGAGAQPSSQLVGGGGSRGSGMRWAVLVTREGWAGVEMRAGPVQGGSPWAAGWVSEWTQAGVSVVSAWVCRGWGAQAFPGVGLGHC